jgi:hypothetical protein
VTVLQREPRDPVETVEHFVDLTGLEVEPLSEEGSARDAR